MASRNPSRRGSGQWFGTIVVVCGGVLISAAVLAIVWLEIVSPLIHPVVREECVVGTTVGLDAQVSEARNAHYILVRLASGDIVRVRERGEVAYKPNASVRIAARLTKGGGARVIAYSATANPVRFSSMTSARDRCDRPFENVSVVDA
jgi:hypothetical protein